MNSMNRTRLWEWRVAHHMSLTDMAGLTGLSEAMLSRVERRQRNLRPTTKVEVARRLGARVADLFDVDPILGEESESVDEAAVS